MPDLIRYGAQAIVYAAMTAMIGYLSASPNYRAVPEGMAQIKLSFRHGAQRVEDCRRLTPEEIAKLPAKERRPNTCSRERIPITVEFDLDGTQRYAAVLQPSGLSRDGPAETYRKFLVPAGPHRLVLRLRDSKRAEGFDYEKTLDVDLAPLQNLAIDFKADQGGFLLR
ncbi:MAG: hypothetical protein KDK89_18645 [Alphaproteobacteria bacterium]|nr:hypothetical protein [Alphaproteobacteria bacterium]